MQTFTVHPVGVVNGGGEGPAQLRIDPAYRDGLRDLGIFATRSPLRPNPLALTVIELAAVDADVGLVETPYLDAADGTPVLDLKPYTPSIDRIEHPIVPAWCAHWPESAEASADFDWPSEFRF